jgi:prepilin-type N-terminal cleavage/methylation domain-containing protein
MKRHRGFVLTELLIVVVIVGIFIGFACHAGIIPIGCGQGTKVRRWDMDKCIAAKVVGGEVAQCACDQVTRLWCQQHARQRDAATGSSVAAGYPLTIFCFCQIDGCVNEKADYPNTRELPDPRWGRGIFEIDVCEIHYQKAVDEAPDCEPWP